MTEWSLSSPRCRAASLPAWRRPPPPSARLAFLRRPLPSLPLLPISTCRLRDAPALPSSSSPGAAASPRLHLGPGAGGSMEAVLLLLLHSGHRCHWKLLQ
ncbi:hypothetical protein SEVIR_6G163950v4 [Setaria viridis]